MQKSKDYLKMLVILMPVFVIATISFNWFMNPYGIYESPKIEGVNKLKPEFYTHLRMAKAWAVYKQKPDGIILGTSRSEYGLNPNHPGWNSELVYNLALFGCNLYEALRYFQHAHAIKPQKQVILAIDFLMFDIFRPNLFDFEESRLFVDPEGHVNPQLSSEKLLTLISIDTFFGSINTLKKQKIVLSEMHLPNGQLHWNAPSKGIRQSGGHRRSFQSTENNAINYGWFHPLRNQYRFTNPKTGQSTLDYFRTFLNIAYRDNVDLRILTSPSHARLWEALYIVGLWPQFEQWKREIVRINEEIAKHYQKPPFPLWDFTGYNSLTTETVPPLDDAKTEMKWYWESSHYKNALGEVVLDRVFEYQHPERVVPDDFGVLLTSKNIDEHLKMIRADQQRYRESNPVDVAEIEKLAKETAARRQSQ